VKHKILFFLGLLPLALTSQTYEISGSVKDSDGAPLPFANVLLLRAADSLQVKGTSADDSGRFGLKQIPPDLYYLKATYFAFEVGWKVLRMSPSGIPTQGITIDQASTQRMR